MAKSARRTFTVEGGGQFPYDMLRYDQCWPSSESHDSSKLMDPYGASGGDSTRRRVVLETDCASGPTARRWESFNWRVVGMGELRGRAPNKEVPDAV